MRKSILLLLTVAGIGLHAVTAYATDSYKDLALFKSGNFGRGLWRMEVLSSNNPHMMQAQALTNGKVSICMNAADNLEKHADMADAQEKCDTKILRNTGELAEVARSCPNGSTHTTITRESDKSFLIDNQMTSSKGKNIQMQARYSYEGACKDTDSVIQMDKNSEACKKMGNMDMTKMAGMCAKLPPDAKAQCEQRVQSMAGMCQ